MKFVSFSPRPTESSVGPSTSASRVSRVEWRVGLAAASGHFDDGSEVDVLSRSERNVLGATLKISTDDILILK